MGGWYGVLEGGAGCSLQYLIFDIKYHFLSQTEVVPITLCFSRVELEKTVDSIEVFS